MENQNKKPRKLILELGPGAENHHGRPGILGLRVYCDRRDGGSGPEDEGEKAKDVRRDCKAHRERQKTPGRAFGGNGLCGPD